MNEIIKNKPKGFGEDNENKYDVIFLMESINTKDVITEIKTKEGIDKIYEGKKVFYISRLMKDFSKSYFSKLIQTTFYENITIRNWNTTKKLYELMQ